MAMPTCDRRQSDSCRHAMCSWPKIVHGGVLLCLEYLYAYLFSVEGVARIDPRVDTRNAGTTEVS